MYDNQVQSTHSIQQLTVEVTGSTIYPTEFIYTYKTNHTALEAKVQVCLKSINQKLELTSFFLCLVELRQRCGFVLCLARKPNQRRIKDRY
jgi:hypothetical protein